MSVSFIVAEKMPVVTIATGDPAGDCLALAGFSLSEKGLELTLAPAAFTRFALEANLGEASGRISGWEDAFGKPLAVSVLIHAGGKVLLFKRRVGLPVQSGRYTASVTGTVEACDAKAHNPLAAAAWREMREETGLSERDGTLSFRGLALAPGKAQSVGLFEFSCRHPPDDVLKSALAWPLFGEEHEAAEFLSLKESLGRPLSPVSRFAVTLFANDAGAERGAAVSDSDREKEALKRLARLDSLTGLLNRLGFMEKLKVEERVGVVLFDLDGLKLVNDRHGHGAGDEVLRLFAAVLSGTARKWRGASAARTGGDEFAALLPAVDSAEAEEFARAVVTDPRLETAPAVRYLSNGAVCAGWGAAVFPDDAADPEGLLAVAEARLKESKTRRESFSLALAAALSRFGDSLSLDEAEAVFDAVLALADRVEPGLRTHCLRVGRLAGQLAKEAQFSAEEIRLAGLAGKFHDIGKIGVCPAVLQKKGPLTAEERTIAEKHPVAGAEMLNSVRVLAPVAEAVRHHHERWDGKGYPDGLKGEKIPPLARIVALADAWDTLTAGRHYRTALPWGGSLGACHDRRRVSVRPPGGGSAGKVD